MLTNIIYESRNLYGSANGYAAKPDTNRYDVLPWVQPPRLYCFEKLRPDADLLQKVLSPANAISPYRNVADRVFGSELKRHQFDLTHSANLFQERCQLHQNHLQDIDYQHTKVQEKVFWLEENLTYPDRLRRLTNLKSQLFQLAHQRREEELAFWKDTVELRKQLFETASGYRDTRRRYSMFSAIDT